MRLSISLVTLGVVCTLLCGCDRHAAVSLPSTPLLMLGSRTLTVEEIAAREQNLVLLHAHGKGKRNGQLEMRIRHAFRQGITNVWVENTALLQCAEREGVIVPEEMLDRYRKGLVKNFRNGSAEGYEDIKSLPGIDARYLEDQVRSEALREAMADHWAAQFPTNLPPGWAQGEINRMLDWNRRLPETRAAVFARATNVWNRLRAGEDFVKTACAETELKEEIQDNCEWGVLDPKMLDEDPDLLSQLQSMEVGQISPPVLGDNGLLIVRLDALAEEKGFQVSRIFFRLPKSMKPATAAEIEAHARKKHRMRLFAAKLADLVRVANVKRPNDSNREESK